MTDPRIGPSASVAVIGAGTMGAGIAQVAAVAGHPVMIYDVAAGAPGQAVSSIRERIAGLVAKGRLDIDPAQLRLAAASSLDELAPARNPAPLMRLVEVVSGMVTRPEVAAAVTTLAQDWGKQVVQAAATPGFIVNRVARPYYAEALRMAEEQVAEPATIDAVLTQGAGFRMGPFALMDLVGQDVNEAVTRSVWTAFGYDPRFAPSLLQRALVEAGWLGRKSGRGWYHYGEGAVAPDPGAARSCPAPPYVTEHGASPLRRLLNRSTTEIRAGLDDGDVVELPS